MHSAVAYGQMFHHRHDQREHRFAYGMNMLLLELDELPQLFTRNRLWSWNRRNVACVLRRDHLQTSNAEMDHALRDVIQAQGHERPSGPIQLLTQPRTWGFCLNPISLFLVHTPARDGLAYVVLEVHNTPWNEQHLYVLALPEGKGYAPINMDFAKAMHVSPFMDMDMHYRLHLHLQAEQSLSLKLENWRDESCLFKAGITLQLKNASPQALNRLLIDSPLMSLKVAAAIYWQALKIRLKGIRYVPYPGKHHPRITGQ